MLAWIHKHGIRIILNILGWGLILNAAYNNSLNYHPAAGMQMEFTWHVIGYNSLFVLFCSINTLWLMPAYFVTQRYKTYLVGLFTLITIFTIIISRYNVWLVDHFRGLEDGQFSSITIGTIGSDMSWINYYLSVLPSVLIVLFIFSIGFLTQQYFRIKKRAALIEKRQIASELSLLKSQINPHFLFNVLNSIYALSLKKSDSTPEIVLKLSEILRYMLYETQQEKVALEKEIDMIESYVGIEKIRIGNLQQISLELKGDFSTAVIAPVLLIPFVENTIKHGLDSMSEHAFVEISIEINNGILVFHAKNNFKRSGIKKAGGIGLENVRKRLELLYPQKHTLRIKEENAIFTVSLNVNLNT
ncbi:hypothetical protein DBR32_05870 [Taibaiella sp. KBW10]|uniref:sensor histidine kinase n=1 Tax=Taibaiella sp. KBW10 TaxID=2153357 RepID=UPI000F5AE1FD|nr:histidine kinase [Taibaiella sp. KBW10]RQO31486.1 hypothetical protein DBR32_05870 [Taibaiella sp. KBW10]